MDKAEATEVAMTISNSLREVSYQDLVDRFLDSCEHSRAVGTSGTEYQIETQAFWDSAKPGDLRVSVTVDNGGWRAFSPLVFDFIKASDGSFVDE